MRRSLPAFVFSGSISFDPNLRPELLAGRDVLDVVGPVLEHTSVLLPGLQNRPQLASQCCCTFSCCRLT